MAAKNSNNNDNNIGFNINSIKNICSKYKKYIATGAMLVLLAVVISTSSKASGDKGPSEPDTTQGTTKTDDGLASEKLEVNAYPQVNELFQDYYKYYAEGDINSIEKIAFPISDMEKSYIKMFSKYVDAYEDIDCYTKNGISEGEYVVTVATQMKFKDIDTGVPNLDSFYVRKDKKGNAYIDNAYSSSNEQFRDDTTDLEVNTLLTEFSQDAEVAELEKSVRKEYDKALEKDEGLKEMVTATVQSGIAGWVASFNATADDDSKGGKDKDDSKKDTDNKDDKDDKGKDNAQGDDVTADPKQGDTENTDPAQSDDGKSDSDKGSDGGSAAAAQTRTAYTKTKVNMREKRSTGSEIIQTLNAGTKVTIYGKSKDGWFKVKCKGKTGFISKEYIVSDLSKVKRTAYAKTTVNMREKRSTDSEVVQTLKPGAKVMIYGKNKDGWFKVRSRGKYGYVKKEYIVSSKSRVERDETQQTQPTSRTSYYSEGDRITLTQSVNIRTGMSENAERVGLAYQGDVVTVIMSYAEGWTKVTWNGQTGYAKTEFLK